MSTYIIDVGAFLSVAEDKALDRAERKKRIQTTDGPTPINLG